MELLEHQAKELFRMVGIPILPSQTIKDSRKIKQLQIPYPVVLKSQVKSGGRGKAGGVRFVANTIDAIAAARTIFNLSILGEYPEVILAEAHYNSEREFFLAVVIDYDLKCPVLLGSAFGGMNVDLLLANLQQVVINTEFSLFHARRLAARMGLSGKLICSVSEIIAKMYRLLREQDLDLIEINPLGVNKQGKLMALDGKITINDYALARQPIIETLSFSEQQKNASYYKYVEQPKNPLNHVSWRWLDWKTKKGKIAIICNSFDLALLTWDLLQQYKVSPACGVIIENSLSGELDSTQLYLDQLQQILRELESVSGIEVILINIWETETISRQIVEAIANYSLSVPESTFSPTQEKVLSGSSKSDSDNLNKQRKSLESHSIPNTKPQFLLRLLIKDNLEQLPIDESIYISSNLEAVISQAIAIVKPN